MFMASNYENIELFIPQKKLTYGDECDQMLLCLFLSKKPQRDLLFIFI